MKLSYRVRNGFKDLVLVAESKAESELIDDCLGKQLQNDDGLISVVHGEVRLSDSYREHYILLRKQEHPLGNLPSQDRLGVLTGPGPERQPRPGCEIV